jgi:Glycosyltransferase Maf N-terminal domain/6-hydroxymethylpterin diphosphokinase MptE-like
MSDRVAQAREAFACHFPQAMALVERGSVVQSSIVTEGDEPIDIRIDGRPVYGGDARRFAAGQVAAYMEKPLRFFVQRLDMSGIVTPIGRKLIDRIESRLRRDEFGECSSCPVGNPTFLIVFGLGLGHHIEPLVRETGARWLIIVEPMAEFFEPSFHVVDWDGLVLDLESKGGGVHIVAETDPALIVSRINGIVMSKGVPYADGSWVFTHYPFWAFTEARNKLHEAVEFSFINRGFWEDELVMMRNAAANFAKYDFRLLEDRPHLQRPETAVIVGAGPSLDDSIETLRRIRDQVVIFSGGTALRPLLRSGITPDFHCELENVPHVHDVLSEAAKYGDLSKITLLASTTVDPRVPALFGRTIFYFRDSVSSTRIFSGAHREIFGTSPTCVNLAMVTSAVMGFTNYVLFGADCGTRPGAARHAKGTVYSDVDAYAIGNRPPLHGIEVEGNFGGIVVTEIIYDACRIMLADTIRYYGLRAINCSDGAVIAGARPCVPEALDIGDRTIDRSAMAAAIDRGTTFYGAGEMLKEADVEAIRRATKEMFADLDALLVELGQGDTDFAQVYDRVMAFVHDAKERYLHTESIISGSLQALPRIAMFYGFRIANDAGRRAFFDLFIAEFRAIGEFMAKTIDALFDDLALDDVPVPIRQEEVAASVG